MNIREENRTVPTTGIIFFKGSSIRISYCILKLERKKIIIGRNFLFKGIHEILQWSLK